MGVRQQQQTGGSLSNVSIGKGIGVGILAWVVTFVLTNLLFVLEVGNSDTGFDYYDRTGWRDLVAAEFGGNYYSAYPGALDIEGLDQLLSRYDTIPDFVYILIVVGILGLLGYRMVSNANAHFDEVGAAAQGATMAISYAVLMGLSVLAVGAFMETGSEVFSDELTNIVLVGGIIYPAVFGGGGGVAAVLKEKQTSGQQPAGRAPPQGQPPAGGQPRSPQQQPGQRQGQPHGSQQAGQPQGGQPQGQPRGGQQSSQPQGGQPRGAQQPGQPQGDRQPPADEPAPGDGSASKQAPEGDSSDAKSTDTSSDTGGSSGGSTGGSGGDI